MARTKEAATHWRNTPAGVRKLKPWPFARMQVNPIRRCADSESDESASSGTSRQVGTNKTRRTARSGHPKNLPHTFVGADGNNDVVVAQPVRGPRVFVGAIPGPHPVVHIDPALQEKSATKSRNGRFFIGNEKMLTHRPPPNIYPINTDAAYNSAPSPAPMQPPSPMSDITASPLPLSPLTRPSTPKSPDSAEHSRSKLPSPMSDTTGSPRPLSPLTLPSTPKSPDSAEHSRSNSTGYGIAVDSSDVEDYSRIAPQAEAICPDSCEKRADDVPIFTDESIGLDLLLFRASTPDGLPVSSLPVGLYGDSLPHHSILNLSPAPSGIDVDGASSTGPSLQASDEDLSQRLHTLRIFSPSPSPSFEISESIDDAAVFSPSPSPSFEISESIDDAAQEQLVSALGMLVYAKLDEHFPFGMLQSAETDFHSCASYRRRPGRFAAFRRKEQKFRTIGNDVQAPPTADTPDLTIAVDQAVKNLGHLRALLDATYAREVGLPVHIAADQGKITMQRTALEKLIIAMCIARACSKSQDDIAFTEILSFVEAAANYISSCIGEQ
ncbi:hypothetical protein B0H16DRAFT_1461955 [Mycena metata]|uniref:Uncharacterized protein n=1 Tax=Mycena metata TaxID=1033252 RepID=A0AAD7IRP7_9AGAR|nr:hypothetical protein B0H16DRAFT_1461955 [Mycena metata]